MNDYTPIHIHRPREPSGWYFTMDDNAYVKFIHYGSKPPNWFNRLMQRWLLGIYWGKNE